MPTPEELSGWKAIAAYLKISVRTAQDYERTMGLPVQHQAGPKGRVFADPEQLDAWQTGAAGNRQTAGRNGRFEEKRLCWLSLAWLRTLTMLWASVSVAVIMAASFYWLTPHGPPSDLRVYGKNLVVVNARGQDLWRHTFDHLLNEKAFIPEGRPSHSWLGDVDGDGQPEVLFADMPLRWFEAEMQVLCFAVDGAIKWRFTPGHPVTDVGGERMVPPYFIRGLQVITGSIPADTRVAVTSSHYLSEPNQVAFLDGRGKVVGEYWHPGHLNYVATADLHHDGRKEVILAGVNNGNHQATMVVIDPRKVLGPMTPNEMQDHRFELLGMPPAREDAVISFPRSCLSRGQPYTRANDLHITKDRVIVVVTEGVAEDQYPEFVYEFDYGMNVLKVTPAGSNVAQAHRALETRGEVDHPFSVECGRLKAAVIVRK